MSKTKKPPYSSPRPAVSEGSRTSLAQELHSLIVGYCLKANDGDAALYESEDIEKFLEGLAVARNPNILLECSANGCSHFFDALHLPFAKDTQCDEDLRVAKAEVLFDLLVNACYDVMKNGGVQAMEKFGHAYADILIKPNVDNYTLMHEALSSKNKGLYDTVVSELRELHEATDGKGHKYISDAEYAEQFTFKTMNGLTPLDNAVRSNNPQLIKAFTADLREALSPEAYRDALLKSYQLEKRPLLQRELLAASGHSHTKPSHPRT